MDKRGKILIGILSIAVVVMFIMAALAIGHIIKSSGKSSQQSSNKVTEGDIELVKNSLEEDSVPPSDAEGANIVIDGYEFLVPSDYACMYAEDVGPVVYMSDVFQLRITVKGRPYDELLEDTDSLTGTAVDAGATLLQEVEQIEINGNLYTYFKIRLAGEDEIVCYADVPDHKTHLGGQIVVQSDSVSDEDLIQMFASIAESAEVTDKPNSTAEDISARFSAVLGEAKENSSLTLNGVTVNYKVAAGYYSTSAFEDEYSATECFDGADSDVLVCLYEAEGEDAQHFANVAVGANEENGAEMRTETVDGKTVYYCTYSYVYNDEKYNYIEAFCDVNNDVYYTVQLDSIGDKGLDFNSIRDFFVFN
jgi:hypothetical protein